MEGNVKRHHQMANSDPTMPSNNERDSVAQEVSGVGESSDIKAEPKSQQEDKKQKRHKKRKNKGKHSSTGGAKVEDS